ARRRLLSQFHRERPRAGKFRHFRQLERDAPFPGEGEDAAVGPQGFESEHPFLLDQRKPVHRVEQKRHEICVEAHEMFSGSSSKCTSARKASNRLRTCARSRARSRSSENCSTVKEAMVEPITVACRSERGSFVFKRSSRPRKPPANESPAPVGSTTSAMGNAGE